ncbi:MAG: GyrI-like domain-containing protein [Ardenticatenales bacterium]|nr:GyrI-like domain-containing protein [Ardenticatenales bacterium]
MSYEVTLADLPEQRTAVVCGHADTSDGIADFLGGAYGEIMGLVERQHLKTADVPFGRYRITADGFDIEAGIGVEGDLRPEGRVEASTLPGGRTARTVHVGAYSGVAAAYEAVAGWLKDNGYVSTDAPWECYLDEPSVPKPRTEVFFPCREALNT